LSNTHRDRGTSPFGTKTLWPTPTSAERGHIDAVISPHETRIEIVRALRLLKSKREILPAKKHGNIPL
jgi:acetyl-CoA carboxylase carboxyltransferase component